MKIAVFGSGGVGGYFGGRLALSGAEVHLIARGPHLEALRTAGLRVRRCQAASADQRGVRGPLLAEWDRQLMSDLCLVRKRQAPLVRRYRQDPQAELLLAALVGCHESTLRIVADHLGVEIRSLEVVAHGEVDARGCLAMDPSVRVGFRSIELSVRLEVADGTDPQRLERLKASADRLFWGGRCSSPWS